MRIAIIGAKSFLAKEIIRQAKDNFEFQAIDSYSPIDYYFPTKSFGNGFNLNCLKDYQVIISCFAKGVQPNESSYPNLTYEVNAFEPIRLINGLESIGFKGKLYTFGSYFEIGQSDEKKSYNENDFVNHTNQMIGDYAKSKRLLTQFAYISAYDLSFDLTHFILPNLYGKGEDENRLIPYIKSNILCNSKMEFSSGKQVRQFVHVSDVASQLIQMMAVEYKGVLNLSGGSISVKEVIMLALDVLSEKYGMKPEFEFSQITKRDTDMNHLELDDHLARQNFGWNPKMTLEEGIAEY